MTRGRAAVIDSRAGETPSVNLPVLPVVPDVPNVPLFTRWARNLTSQLDIWFEQIKSTIVQLYGMILDRLTWDVDYVAGDEVAKNVVVNDNGWLMVSNKRTTDRAGAVPTGPAESLYIDDPTWTIGTQNAKITSVTTIDVDQGTGIFLERLRVWIPAPQAGKPAFTVSAAIRLGATGNVVTESFGNDTYVPDQWNTLALSDAPLPTGSRVVLTLEYDANLNTKYVYYPSYWVTNEPSWGSVSATLAFDDVDQPGNSTTGFGVDITGTPAEVSLDWDFMSYTPLGSTPDDVLVLNEIPQWASEQSAHLTVGEVSTTDNVYTEVLRMTLDRSTYGSIYCRANRTDGDDIYNCHQAFSALLSGGSLTVTSSTVYEITTAPTLRVRVDGVTNELVFEVKGALAQDWDWRMTVLTNDYI